MSDDRDKILQLYRNGTTWREIERQTGVAKATISKYVKKAGLSRRAPNGEGVDQRPLTTCQWCGVTCRSRTNQCRECYRFGIGQPVEDPIGLRDGAWVPNGRGTLVWRPARRVA